jgi:hypothetical protein
MRLALGFPLAALAGGLLFALAPAGCGHTSSSTATHDAGAHDASALCAPCQSSSTCGDDVCAQVGGDTYCLQACPNGDECPSGSVCEAVTTSAGQSESVCLAQTDICGTGQGAPPPAPDAGCASYIAPTSDAGHCGQCAAPDGGTSRYCQANGCRHGLYCDVATNTCTSAPGACGGTAVALDAGEGVDGSVTPDGGTLSRLYFAVVGDTRPPNEDETTAYPTQIITKIFTDLAALSPMPSFVVSTGDYQFASTTGTEQGPQLDLYVAARANYPGLQFPAVGNHECTGATASNCGTGNVDGVTTNFTTFASKLLAPIGQTSPYYVVNFGAPDGSWTAKFVFVAANFWDATQSTWLDQALSVATTYTFVVRHESADTTTTPGVSPSEAIIAKYPYTLEIVGHTHTYGHIAAKEVLFGNGGAPLSGSGNYGYGIFSQQPDGTIAVDAVDYQTGLADGSFHFAVNPDGSPAP